MKKITICLAILFIILILFISCTHKPYHPTKSENEWAADHKICEKWVREGIRDEPDTYDNLDEMKLIKECMKKKGWRWERAGWLDFKKEESK